MTTTETVIAAAREVLACEEQRLRFKVALPDSPRHKDWELVKQFPERHSAAWKALLFALAALDAEAPQELTISAIEMAWSAAGSNEWRDDRYGFYITFDAEEDEPYGACFGEGNTEQFTTLEAAQRWCQDEIDRWVRSCVVVTTKPPTEKDKQP